MDAPERVGLPADEAEHSTPKVAWYRSLRATSTRRALLLTALGGLLISSMAWALGSFGGNYNAVSRGKTGVIVCAACALIAGAAAPIINFFANLGSAVH